MFLERTLVIEKKINVTFLLSLVWINYFLNGSHDFYKKDEVRNEEAWARWTTASLSVNNDNKEKNVNFSQQTLTSSEGHPTESIYMVVTKMPHPGKIARSIVQRRSYKETIKGVPIVAVETNLTSNHEIVG